VVAVHGDEGCWGWGFGFAVEGGVEGVEAGGYCLGEGGFA
jgi:hypothetical protein